MNALARIFLTKFKPSQLVGCVRGAAQLSTDPPSVKIFSEPDYLHLLEPEFPIHPLLDVEITGHDFPLVESYQKLIHKICELTDLQTVDGWATPAQSLRIINFKSNSEIKLTEYELKVYRRHLQLKDVPAWKLSTFLRLLETTAPQGVTLNVVEHTEHHDEERYVPDSELIALKNQLEEIKENRKK